VARHDDQPELVTFGPIKFLRGRRQGRYPYCHSIIIEDEALAVIDPSADKEHCRHLAQSSRLSAVFVSHFHEDHQKYLFYFPETVIWAPAADAAAFTSMAGVFDLLGLEDPDYIHYWQKTLVEEFHYRPLAEVQTFIDDDEMLIGRIRLQVIHTPGHTPGHSCFYFPEQDILYLADMDLTPFGPWYGDLTSDLNALLASLQRLEDFQAEMYLTAHGQGVFSGKEAKAAFVRFKQVIFDREAEILSQLQTPRTINDLVSQRLIYRKLLEPTFVYNHIEKQMISKHVQRLMQIGLVQLTEDGYVAA
jgi:glyoxylase-like metal-dependent hydrolase (beta-lactamase superfamily II)